MHPVVDVEPIPASKNIKVSEGILYAPPIVEVGEQNKDAQLSNYNNTEKTQMMASLPMLKKKKLATKIKQATRITQIPAIKIRKGVATSEISKW